MCQLMVAITLLFPQLIPLHSLVIPAVANGDSVESNPDKPGPHTGLTLENQNHRYAANNLHWPGELPLKIKKWTTANKGPDTFIHDPIIRQGAIEWT